MTTRHRLLALFLCAMLLVSISGCQKKGTDRNAVFQIGQPCPGTNLAVFNEKGLTGETVNPAKTGKITVINFWGTWCPYCLYEMPHLDKIATEYVDKVSIIAAHTDISGTDAIDYVAKNLSGSKIIFANDEMDAYYATLGGDGSYPYSVILDENGVVATSFYGYRDYDSWSKQLSALLD